MTMQNEPQLSAEMEIVTKFRQFLANWDYAHLTRKVSVEESRQMCDEFALTLATALEEQGIKQYKKALSDMFLEIAKLAEPDERQPSAGDLKTNMDNIWEIRKKLEKAILNRKEE